MRDTSINTFTYSPAFSLKTGCLKAFVLFVIGLAWQCSFAQADSFSSVYRPGTQLYVYALTGLNLRAQPSAQAPVVSPVKFGEAVTVLKDSGPRVSFTASGILGAWVKVRFGAKEGYQFDGYLSRWDPLQLNDNQGITEYLRERFSIQSETAAPKDTVDYKMYEKVKFENGIDFLFELTTGIASLRITFPASLITFQELYLIARLVYPDFISDKSCPYTVNNMQCEANGATVWLTKNKESTFTMRYYKVR